MKTVAIIQARMGSTRLPGKILMKVMDKPLLEYQIERVQRSKRIDEIVVATTTDQKDDEIVAWCNKMNVTSYRGSEDDVLSRYYEAATKNKADLIVRITSDCPLIDPDVIDQTISLILQNDYDYVSNILERTYPRGMDVEVFWYTTLEKTHVSTRSQAEREHVTPFIYRNPSLFKLGGVTYPHDLSKYRWTVDTVEDFNLIENILTHLYTRKKEFTLEDVLRLLEQHPEWNQINAHIEQKKIGE